MVKKRKTKKKKSLKEFQKSQFLKKLIKIF